MLATPYDIWDDLVVYRARASVGIVDLSTGEDRVVFPSQVVEEEHAVGYLDPRISSRYVVALMHSESYIDGEWRFGQEAVVARNLSDLSGPEIVLARYYYEDGLTPIFIDVYEEWATWSVPSPSTGYHDLVLCNIETGEQRVIVREHSGYSVSIPAIWGDRVVWGTSDQVLEEYRISTGETRIAFHATTEMGNVGGVSIWENYVTFYSFGHQAVLVNLDTGETQQPLSLESTKESVSINNGRIVWTDFRGAEPPAGMHIYLYSLRTGREYVLNPSAIGGSTPLIFDRNVVWGGQQDTGVVGRWVTRIGDI